MGKNLTGKTAFIIAMLVIFVYGIIGIPHGGLKQSITDRIHLGLDLKGGTHLVLEVHVAEAVASTTDRDVQRMQADLEKAGIHRREGGEDRPASQPQTMVVSGVPAAKQSDARAVLEGNDYGNYDLTTNPDGSLKLTMKPGGDPRPRERDAGHSIETIRERVDTLGVSEPVIQQYGLGDNEILVELPGVDDPAQVEDDHPVDLEAGDLCRGQRPVRRTTRRRMQALNGVDSAGRPAGARDRRSPDAPDQV